MNKFFTLTLLTATTVINVHAQDFKFGKISQDDLTKSESKINKEAAAEVLYSSIKTVVDWNETTGDLEKKYIVSYRIKVFNKDNAPSNALTLEIPLYKSDYRADTERLLSFKGSTFNLEGGSTKEYKASKSDIFTKDIHKYLTVQTVTFPNIKDGSVIDYTYEVVSPHYYNIDTWYFQENIPVVNSNLSFETHEYLNYQADFRGQFQVKPVLSNRETSKNIFIKEDLGNKYVTRKTTEIQRVDYKLNKVEYTLENLPGFETEAYVLNPRNILSSIRFELASYTPRNTMPKYFSTTWEQIGLDLWDNESFGRQLNGNGFLEDKVKELTADKSTAEEKMNAIFNFVKTNYTWDNYTSLYADKGIRKTFNEKTGNVADINLMLVSMLQKAGLNANPVVLSTVQNGIINYIFPSKGKLNYVIALVNINNKEYLMDATEKNSSIDLLPIRALNHRGFTIAKDGIREVSLINTIMSGNKETIVATIDETGNVSGNYNNYVDNYFYMTNKSALENDPKQFEKEFIEDYNFDVESFRSLDNKEGIIRNSFKFNNVKADVISNKILLNPFLFIGTTSHNLHYDTRNYNLEFGAPMNLTKSIKIKIPTGYKVESLPTKVEERIVNDAAIYVFTAETKDGFVHINSVRVLPYSILPPDYYKPFKNLMNKVVETESQQIVFVKE